MIDFHGKQIEIMELSKEFGVPWSTIRNRYEAGYRGDDLVAKRLNPVMFHGEQTTLAEIAIKFQLPYELIKSRYSEGKRDDELVQDGHQGIDNKNAATKLTAEKVVEIKRLLILSPLNQTEIARLFNVDPSHISDIKRRKRWASVVVDVEEILSEPMPARASSPS